MVDRTACRTTSRCRVMRAVVMLVMITIKFPGVSSASVRPTGAGLDLAMPAAVVALVDDLMFVSRIREAARGHGLDVRTVRRIPELLEACRDHGRLVVLDLDTP